MDGRSLGQEPTRGRAIKHIMILMACLSLCFELLWVYDGSVLKCYFFYGSSQFDFHVMSD